MARNQFCEKKRRDRFGDLLNLVAGTMFSRWAVLFQSVLILNSHSLIDNFVPGLPAFQFRGFEGFLEDLAS